MLGVCAAHMKRPLPSPSEVICLSPLLIPMASLRVVVPRVVVSAPLCMVGEARCPSAAVGFAGSMSGFCCHFK